MQCRTEDLDYLAEVASLGFAGAGARTLPTSGRIPYTKEAAADAAQATRKALGVDEMEPLFSLPHFISSKLRIFFFPIQSRTIFTASVAYKDVACLFANSVGVFDLLSCARELGQVISACSRRPVEPVANIQARNIQSLVGGPKEHFCENFAGDLLLPSKGLAVALKQIRKTLRTTQPALGDIELLYLARIFGVNFVSACRRCERLGLLPPGGGAALLAHLRERFGSVEAREKQLELPPATQINVPSPAACALQWLHGSIKTGVISIDEIAAATAADANLLGSMYAVGRAFDEFR